MKNKLSDLNDHLFAELERLADENLDGDALHAEIRRAGAICDVAEQVVGNARLVLEAHKALADSRIAQLPPMLGQTKSSEAN